MATYELPISSPLTDSGDDVYCKPTDSDFTGGGTWVTSVVAATEVEDTNVYLATLDETKGYLVYLNGSFNSFTVDAGTDVFTDNAHGLINGDTLRFKGTDLPAPLEQSTIYYVRDATTNTFKVAATAGGAAIDVTDVGSGTMVYVAPSQRSKAADVLLGTVPVVNAATLTGESEEALAAAVVAAVNADATQTTARTNAATAAAQTAPAALRTAMGLESANLANLVNAVIGKKVVTPVGDGRFDIAVRNAADSATLVTIRHNPVTGDTVVL